MWSYTNDIYYLEQYSLTMLLPIIALIVQSCINFCGSNHMVLKTLKIWTVK